MSSSHLVNGYTLDAIVAAVREHAGFTNKAPIAGVRAHFDASDPVHGPGDDGAIIEVGGHNIVACGEALSPPFVQDDPYGAGIAAVLANVNDVAAMGGVALGIVNTVVGPAECTAEVLRGMQAAALMYQVPVIGGHLTERDGETSVSAFAVGRAERVLSMANVRSGQVLLFAAFLDGEMRVDFPFFSSIDQQAHRFGADVRVMAEVASAGLAVAAKDVSMCGALGSVAMLLEFTRHGAVVDMGRVPVPADTDFLRWLVAFPSYAFWLTAEPETAQACIDHFRAADLVCVAVGEITDTATVTLVHGTDRAELIDLRDESVTGLWT